MRKRRSRLRRAELHDVPAARPAIANGQTLESITSGTTQRKGHSWDRRLVVAVVAVVVVVVVVVVVMKNL